MSTRAFTLILTKGTHSVSAEAAARIVRAMENHEPLVEVELDLFGAGDVPRRVTLATGHVIALSLNPKHDPCFPAEEGRGATIALLRPRAALGGHPR